MPVGRPKRKALDRVETRVAVAMYQGGETLKGIADALDASYWEVRAVMLKNGVKLRKRGARPLMETE